MAPAAAPAAAALLAALALLAATAAASSSPLRTCPNDRVSGGVAHAYCGLPYVAANFQSYFLCQDGPQILLGGKDGLDEAAIAAAVAEASSARAAGLGHGWWKEGWCPVPKHNGINSINKSKIGEENGAKTTPLIVPLTEQRGVALVSSGDAEATHEFLLVDRTKMTVTCPAGLSQRALLRALDHWDEIEEAYGGESTSLLEKAKKPLPTPESQRRPRRRLNSADGLTLEAFSWFIDQTIGGAVASGSHGSSFRFGSLSSQMRAGRFVLANGTVIAVERPSSGSSARWPDPRTATLQEKRDEYLWRALAVSTGRLGVLTEVTMDIAPNERRVRTSIAQKPDDFFLNDVQKLAERYAAAVASAEKTYPDDPNARNEAVWRSVRDFDEVQAFWFVPSNKIVSVRFEREGGMTPAEFADAQREAGLLNATTTAAGPPDVREMSADNAKPPPPRPSYAAVAKADAANAAALSLNPAGPLPAIERAPKTWSKGYELMLSTNTFNATLPARAAYASCSEIESALHIAVNAYDQYEVALPLAQLAKGKCLPLLLKTLYDPSGPQSWRGFRAPALVRFIAGERPFLSPSNGVGPVVYINLEDHISYALGGGQGRTAEEREKARNEAAKAARKGKTPEQSRAGTVESPLMRNPEFDAVMRVLRGPECRGRLHWAKAGWPTYASIGAAWRDGDAEQQDQIPPSCFDGAAEYAQSWCDFGCATAELDPDGKFEPESGADTWWWGASVVSGGVDGAAATLATTSGTNGAVGASSFARECCGPTGFRSDRCKCVRRAEAGGAATCRSVVV
jgi:hypothetical protein